MLTGGPAVAPRHQTLHAALEHAARSRWGLTFLDAQERETPLSFAELYERAQRAAGGLREQGIAPGDRVAIVLPTGPDFMDAFFGTVLAGAIPVPLYPPLRLGRMDEFHRRTARMIRACGARLVLSDARISRLLGVAVAEARPPLGLRRLQHARPLVSPAAPDDLLLIQFSSGTTVDPKPVALTHANVLANVAAIETIVPTDDAQAGVSWLPLYHDMGLIGCLLCAVDRPGPLTLIPPELFLARPAIWLRAISRKRATISVAPNFAYGLCLRRVRDRDLEGVDLSSWRFALNGAEPVAPAVLRRFSDRFASYGFDARALMPVYGLSEASLAVTFTPSGRGPRTVAHGARELASVGAPLPGIDLDVREGRIFVRGPSVMREYFGNRAATDATLRGGWLDTGDLGFLQDGELFVSGRAKDVVILRGSNHSPQEFEEALDGVAGVRPGCAAAVGIPTAEGEQLALLVEADGAADAEQIRARVTERTGIRPHEVHLLAPGTLPRTSSGKLRRGEALRQLQSGELRPPDPVTLLHVAKETARSLLARLQW
ncbi:MAG: fatty acyl-AMP ligase [Deltaproteobacteria bacterium]|nr:MAG: fatty acyl-AMP ligase [Deltaproteobacteria bacterium]